MTARSVMYDTATFHTRLDGTEDAGLRRRSIHQYYTRGGWDEHGRPPIQYPGKSSAWLRRRKVVARRSKAKRLLERRRVERYPETPGAERGAGGAAVLLALERLPVRVGGFGLVGRGAGADPEGVSLNEGSSDKT